VRTVEQLIADVKRVNLSIDAIVMDRGMASKNNLLKLNGDNLKMIAGIPLTSNEAKELVMRDISEENELMRLPSSNLLRRCHYIAVWHSRQGDYLLQSQRS